MPNNFLNRNVEQTPAEIQRGVRKRNTIARNKQKNEFSKLKTPEDFKTGFFGGVNVNVPAGGRALRDAVEAGDLNLANRFFEAGIQLDERASRIISDKIRDVQGLQRKFTPAGIEKMGGMRNLLLTGLPGDEKTKSFQTPKGAVEKSVKGPSFDDRTIRELVAGGDTFLEATRKLARAKKGEPLEEKGETSEEGRKRIASKRKGQLAKAKEDREKTKFKERHKPTPFEQQKLDFAEKKFNASLDKVKKKKKATFKDVKTIVENVAELASDVDGVVDDNKAWNLFQGARESLPDDTAKTNLFNSFFAQFGPPPPTTGRLQQDVNAGPVRTEQDVAQDFQAGLLTNDQADEEIKKIRERSGI